MTTASTAAEHFVVDTTEWSLLHVLLRDRTGRPRSRVGAYLVAVLLTYVPLLLAVLTDRTTPSDRGTPCFSFFVDGNVLCMFLVTFPTLLLLTVTDDSVLRAALERIQTDGDLVL